MTRVKLLAYVEYAYAAAATIIGLPLFLLLGPARTVENGTSVRVLGAVLLALSYGAYMVARDPVRNRALIVVEMVFMALASLALVYRIVVDHNTQERAWLILPPMLVCLALLLVLFPREPAGDAKERGAP